MCIPDSYVYFKQINTIQCIKTLLKDHNPYQVNPDTQDFPLLNSQLITKISDRINLNTPGISKDTLPSRDFLP